MPFRLPMRLLHSFALPPTLILAALLPACAPDLPDDVDAAMAELPPRVDYNLHIKPILSDKCFHCHGPDTASVEASLRLDQAEYAYASLESGAGKAIVPGNLSRSQLVGRILSEDPDHLMPPPRSNLRLNEHEKALLLRWIQDGATYQPHWSFIPPKALPRPSPQKPERIWNEVDHFVHAKAEAQGLSLAPMADKATLLRRLSFDLTGLPPSLEELDAFLNDQRPDAYERKVDELLQSEAHAERMALDWLDLARYADSHGYQSDGLRIMWPWRDWVIKAFHDNMPYDQFVSWQLAGDLMPEASQSQRLATAFLRNHTMNSEAGIIDEEYRLSYVFDRVNTVSTSLMGLTMECAQCHDHKYDPFSQKNYYQLAAFFNNVNEIGLIANDLNVGPLLLLHNDSTQRVQHALQQQLRQQAQQIAMAEEEVRQVKAFLHQLPPASAQLDEGLQAFLPMNRLTPQKDKPPRLDGQDAYRAHGGVELVPGKQGQGVRLNIDDDFQYLSLSKRGQFELNQPFSGGAWIRISKKGVNQVVLTNAGPKNAFWRGWEFYVDSMQRSSLRLISDYPDNYLHVSALDTVAIDQWQHVFFAYDGLGQGKGVSIYVNGAPSRTRIKFDALSRSMLPVNTRRERSERPVRAGRSYRTGTGEFGIFFGDMDEIRLYEREVSALEVAAIANEAPRVQTASHSTNDPVHHHRLLHHPGYQQARQGYRHSLGQLTELLTGLQGIMVMREREAPRQMYVYARGAYDAPTEPVFPATPEVIDAFDPSLPQDRRGLSQWLFQPDHPLTARVAVNRYWQMLFGQGLVKTPHDFGNQGALPSHPQLLDWLAVHFVESGWNLRQLLKTMVMSKTYRRSSIATEAQRLIDPDNLYLARFPTYRLQAEMIRDHALASSGLLNRRVGGESVKPYQPEGLWEEKGQSLGAFINTYRQDSAAALYRRSLYTFIKRSSPPPSMQIFDAPSREYCVVKRERTSTPLQSLVLLNDPQFVEAARALAQRLQAAHATPEARLTVAFRSLTGRPPEPEELSVLQRLLDEELRNFAAAPEAARALLALGEHPFDPQLPSDSTAALAVLCNLLMNHDAFYTKRQLP